MDIVLNELKHNNINDISTIQALILKNINSETTTISMLYSYEYLGKNLTYNINDLCKSGYVDKKPNDHDKRTIYVILTKKGENISNLLKDIFCKLENKISLEQSLGLKVLNGNINMMTDVLTTR